MTIYPKIITLSRMSLVAALIVPANLATVALFPATAHAVGDRQCYVTTYFNDAKHDQLVGQYSTCPGGTFGRRTQYSTTQVVSFDNGSPGSPGDGPSVPCEFQADNEQCLNLPVARRSPNNGLHPINGGVRR